MIEKVMESFSTHVVPNYVSEVSEIAHGSTNHANNVYNASLIDHIETVMRVPTGTHARVSLEISEDTE